MGTLPSVSSARSRYGFALAAWAAAAALTGLMLQWLGTLHPIAAYLAAIMLTGWYAGAGPAVLAWVLTMLSDRALPALLAGADPFTFGIQDLWFALFCVGAAYFGSVRRRMIADLQGARDHLEELVALRTRELLRKERYLDQAQRLSQTGCWAFPLAGDGHFWCSEELFRIFGLDPAGPSLDLEGLFALMHPDDVQRVREVRGAAIRELREFDIEYRLVRPSGEVRRIRSVGQPCFDTDGSVAEYLGVVMDITNRRHAERALRLARERALHLRFRARLEERARIARDMHDTLLQGVTGLTLELLAVTNRIHAPPDEVGELRAVVDMAQRTLRDARQAISGMRAPSHGTLPDAVLATAEDAIRSSTMRLDFSTKGVPREVGQDIQDALVLVVREAVRNAVRHSGGLRVGVEIAYRRHCLRLTVSDDGRGFVVDPELRGYGGHWGLLGMRERMADAGGRLRIRSALGRGTTLRITQPYQNIGAAASVAVLQPGA